MRRAYAAGLVYFILVFVLGTIFGVVRTIFLAPLTGSIIAVMIEIPLILAVAWFVCRFTIRRLNVSARISERLKMGMFAFFCLMAGEMVLVAFLDEGGVMSFFQKCQLPETGIGLAGQIAFALFPVIQRYKI